jgi:hypothetical protein
VSRFFSTYSPYVSLSSLPSNKNACRATIKIPLNKLKRDGFDRHEKSAAQLAIEAELAKRKEEDSGFEDVTDVS